MPSTTTPTPLSVSWALGLNCVDINQGPIERARPARKNTKSNIKSPFLGAVFEAPELVCHKPRGSAGHAAGDNFKRIQNHSVFRQFFRSEALYRVDERL